MLWTLKTVRWTAKRSKRKKKSGHDTEPQRKKNWNDNCAPRPKTFSKFKRARTFLAFESIEKYKWIHFRLIYVFLVRKWIFQGDKWINRTNMADNTRGDNINSIVYPQLLELCPWFSIDSSIIRAQTSQTTSQLIVVYQLPPDQRKANKIRGQRNISSL